MKLTQLAKRVPQHIIVYGEPKTGKSTLVSKLTEKFNLLWISTDAGHGVLYKLSPEQQDKIDIIVLPDTRESPVAFDTIKKLMAMRPTRICHTHGIVECSVCKKNNPEAFSTYNFSELTGDTIVVIDHITQLGDSCMNILTKNEAVDYKPSFNDYGAQGMHLGALLTQLQQASFNLVAIAQPLEVELEDGKKKLVPAIGTRNFSATVSKYFDSMVFLEVTNKSHRSGSSTTYTTTAITGSRNDVKIEDLKEASLIPFFTFDPTKPSPATTKVVEDKANATKILGDTVKITNNSSSPVVVTSAAGSTTVPPSVTGKGILASLASKK